jgi:hypothetical protein
MLIGDDSLQGGYNSAVFALRLRAVSKRYQTGPVPGAAFAQGYGEARKSAAFQLKKSRK